MYPPKADCIAVALGLPQLKILWQRELESHIEVTVIYRRDKATCPQCGEVTNKEQVVEGKGRQKVEEYLDSLPEPFRQAVQICLPLAKVVVDKFHLIRHVNEALDKVRTKLQGGNRRGKRGELFRRG